jgi:hypothetical protein
MTDFSLTSVLQIKTSKIINDMAKVQQKSETTKLFDDYFHPKIWNCDTEVPSVRGSTPVRPHTPLCAKTHARK